MNAIIAATLLFLGFYHCKKLDKKGAGVTRREFLFGA